MQQNTQSVQSHSAVDPAEKASRPFEKESVGFSALQAASRLLFLLAPEIERMGCDATSAAARVHAAAGEAQVNQQEGATNAS